MSITEIKNKLKMITGLEVEIAYELEKIWAITIGTKLPQGFQPKGVYIISKNTGKILGKYISVVLTYSENKLYTEYALVETSYGHEGLIDNQGKLVIPCEYNFRSLDIVNEKLIAINTEHNHCVLGLNGEILLSTPKVVVGITKCDTIIIKEKNKYGVITLENKVIIPYDYAEIEYKQGVYLVYKSQSQYLSFDKQVGVISKNGVILIKPEYDEIICEKTYYKARKGGTWELFDANFNKQDNVIKNK